MLDGQMLRRDAFLLQVFSHLHVLSENDFEIGLRFHQIPNQIVEHLIPVNLPYFPHDCLMTHFDHFLHEHHL